MTVTYLGEDTGGRRAQNNLGTRTYTRVFKLKASSKSDSAYTVGSNASLPIIGSVYPDDAGAWCRTLIVENNDPFAGWKVTAEYSSEVELGTDPTTDPAIIDWSSEQFQKVAWIAYAGTGILNSAGDFFDPPNMMDDTRRSVRVTKNLASVPSWILSYQDAVNSDTFSVDGVSIGIGVAKMQRVDVGRKEKRNGVSFRTVEFDIHFRKEGWLLRPLDAGFREKQGAGRINMTNQDGTLPAAPICLDGSGAKLANPTLSNAVFLSFIVYETKAFSSLPLT